jgi:hypothetical protein
VILLNDLAKKRIQFVENVKNCDFRLTYTQQEHNISSTMKVAPPPPRCTIKPLEQTPHDKGRARSKGFRYT